MLEAVNLWGETFSLQPLSTMAMVESVRTENGECSLAAKRGHPEVVHLTELDWLRATEKDSRRCQNRHNLEDQISCCCE